MKERRKMWAGSYRVGGDEESTLQREKKRKKREGLKLS